MVRGCSSRRGMTIRFLSGSTGPRPGRSRPHRRRSRTRRRRAGGSGARRRTAVLRSSPRPISWSTAIPIQRLTSMPMTRSPASSRSLTAGTGALNVLGIADDASSVYFDDDARIFVWHDGTVRVVAVTISTSRGAPLAEGQTARTSADGTRFAFVSSERLTDYDNHGFTEVYTYNARAGQLECASCRPDGARRSGGLDGRRAVRRISLAISVAMGVRCRMTASGCSSRRLTGWSPRTSTAPLDVYVYVDGRPRLLSGGQGPSNAFFQDASADGSDAFFTTRAGLVAADTDDRVDLYNARVDGGYRAPVPTPACVEDICQGVATSNAPPPVAGSALFTGAEPVAPAAVVPGKSPLRGSRR